MSPAHEVEMVPVLASAHALSVPSLPSEHSALSDTLTSPPPCHLYTSTSETSPPFVKSLCTRTSPSAWVPGEGPVAVQPDGVLEEPEADVGRAHSVEDSVLPEVEDEVVVFDVAGGVRVGDVVLRRRDRSVRPLPLADVERVLRAAARVPLVGAVRRVRDEARELERRAESVPVAPAAAGCVAVELEAVDVGVGRRSERHCDQHRGDSNQDCDCEQALEGAGRPHLVFLLQLGLVVLSSGRSRCPLRQPRRRARFRV